MVVRVKQFTAWKQQGQPVAVLTAWDYMSGQMADQAGADMILVGDSLAMVALGYENTLPLTLDEMLHHAKAVRRGRQKCPAGRRFAFSELSDHRSRRDALRRADAERGWCPGGQAGGGLSPHGKKRCRRWWSQEFR